jgi:hypothetical protein
MPPKVEVNVLPHNEDDYTWLKIVSRGVQATGSRYDGTKIIQLYSTQNGPDSGM